MSYKLFYFNLRGRGELARFVFAQAGVEYEDVRIEFKDWPEMKPKMPFEVIPVLEVDGSNQRISGSVNIPRYLAERFGLAGESALENAQIASIVRTNARHCSRDDKLDRTQWDFTDHFTSSHNY